MSELLNIDEYELTARESLIFEEMYKNIEDHRENNYEPDIRPSWVYNQVNRQYVEELNLQLCKTHYKFDKLLFLEQLGPVQWLSFLENMIIEEYSQGDMIYEQGDLAQHFYVIKKGSVYLELGQSEDEFKVTQSRTRKRDRNDIEFNSMKRSGDKQMSVESGSIDSKTTQSSIAQKEETKLLFNRIRYGGRQLFLCCFTDDSVKDKEININEDIDTQELPFFYLEHFFGEAELFDQNPIRKKTAVAAQPTIVYKISKEILQNLLENEYDFWPFLINMQARERLQKNAEEETRNHIKKLNELHVPTVRKQSQGVKNSGLISEANNRENRECEDKELEDIHSGKEKKTILSKFQKYKNHIPKKLHIDKDKDNEKDNHQDVDRWDMQETQIKQGQSKEQEKLNTDDKNRQDTTDATPNLNELNRKNLKSDDKISTNSKSQYSFIRNKLDNGLINDDFFQFSNNTSNESHDNNKTKPYSIKPGASKVFQREIKNHLNKRTMMMKQSENVAKMSMQKRDEEFQSQNQIMDRSEEFQSQNQKMHKSEELNFDDISSGEKGQSVSSGVKIQQLMVEKKSSGSREKELKIDVKAKGIRPFERYG